VRRLQCGPARGHGGQTHGEGARSRAASLRRDGTPAEAEQRHKHRRHLGSVGCPVARRRLHERQHDRHAARGVRRAHTQHNEWDDFAQVLLERAEFELSRRGSATPEPEPELEAEPEEEAPGDAEAAAEGAEGAAVKQEADTVFARHADAHKRTLMEKGMADLVRLARSGKRGADGSLVANGWRPAVAGPDDVRGYASDAAPRGKHAPKRRPDEGALDDEYDPAYDSEDSDDAAASPPVDAAAAAPTDLKRKRAKGAKVRIKKTLGEGLVFWCALCNDQKPLQSLKAMEAHRGGGKTRGAAGAAAAGATARSTSCVRTASSSLPSRRPRPPQQSKPTGNRGTGGRGAHGGGRSGPGRGRKSEATRAAEKAKLAAFLVAKYGSGDSKLAAAAAASSDAADAEVEVEGERTWAERVSATPSCVLRP